MLTKIKFLVSLLMLISIFSQAQIGLNTSTLSGNATLGYQITSADNYKLSSSVATFNPSYGKFIGKKTLLSLQPDMNYYGFKRESTQSFGSSEWGNVGLNANIRHYINPDAKFKFYGEANVGVTKKIYNYDLPSNQKFEQTLSQLGGAIGANYFFNKTIALDAKVGYLREQSLAGSKYSTDKFYIGVGLANFMHADSEVGEGAELIEKGRKSIDGNIGVNINDFGTNYQIKAKYSQFIANGLMVGGSIEAANEPFPQRFQFEGFKVDAMVRYYVPLTKKLFIYPEAKVSYFNLSSNKFYYELGVGMSYFIKKNVALDIDIFKLGASQGQTNTFLGANVGLKYFLK
jgi:Outer membrane protein beta-barrel domain